MAGKIYLEKICPYCYIKFTPHPKVGDRQICCGTESCKRQHKKELNRKWRKNNPDYFKGRYQTYLKPWLIRHPDYLKNYRQNKKTTSTCKFDIQEQLTYEKTISYPKTIYDIQEQLTSVNSMNYLVFKKLSDIQEQLISLNPLPV